MNAVAILRQTLPADAPARFELKEIANRIEALALSVDRRRSAPPVPLRGMRRPKG